MRKRWEYKNVWIPIFDIEDECIDAPMNKIGRDGWELVCAGQRGKQDEVIVQQYTFKRPLRSK